jgi:hypothetical protein
MITLREFVLSVLDDDNGISTEAWEKLNDLLHSHGEFELLGELASRAEATDGRFYIK